ncbi:MAG: methionine adenosyltransferase [Bradymonadaceae bacterium]
MSRDSIFTSESVAAGHPDKIADQISDGILDALIEKDPDARVACETMVNTGLALIFGEITTSAYVDMPEIVRSTINDIGYDDPEWGFDHRTCSVMTAIDEQSRDIRLGVNDEGGGVEGAGDQGLMFGYACDETDQYMPMPIVFAHRLVERLADVRRSGDVDFLGPDGKSQVTVRYEDDEPVAVDAVVVSTQHRESVSRDDVENAVMETVIKKVIPEDLFAEETDFYVNPTGRFVSGGPSADAGLTGRKVIVDTYGGMGRHGGGAFSGKDPSKVDRSATYQARHIAKNIVAADLASRCEVQLAYAIGVAEPVSVNVDTQGTGRVPEGEIEGAVREHFALTPDAIIDSLDLLRPIYQDTAAYGHFGRPEFSWESTGRADQLRDELL